MHTEGDREEQVINRHMFKQENDNNATPADMLEIL